MTEDYQSKNEYLVLGAVKKCPLYSVDKLAQEFPDISRRSIQRILEKNNLSTVEKRLSFSDTQKTPFLFSPAGIKTKLLDFFKQIQPGLDRLRILLKNFLHKPQLKWQLVRNLAVFLLVGMTIWAGVSFINLEAPDISLDQPEAGFINKGERLFVSGKVMPKNSRVTVNGSKVSLNGDGTFTAVVNISMGESALEVKAVKARKTAQVLRLITRVATDEELQAQQDKQEEKRKEAADKSAQLERTVNDLMAARSANEGKDGSLRVLNNHINEESGFLGVVGEIANLGKEDVSWVMITVNFYDQSGGKIDTKYGFATDFEQTIKAGKRANFETQTTRKQFDHYSLELSWEEGVVAGAASAKPSEEATTSAEEREKDNR